MGDADPDEFYHDYAIVNVEHSDRIIEGLRFVFIDLKKFKPKTIAERKMAVLWLRFLTEIDESTQEVPAELLENVDTRKALEIVEKSAYTDSQLLAYDDFWMSVVDEKVIVEDALKKGRAEERLKNARNLKENGVPIDVIAVSLGLTEEEISKL